MAYIIKGGTGGGGGVGPAGPQGPIGPIGPAGSGGYYGVNQSADDSYTVTISGIASYVEGMIINFKATVANNGICSLNVNGLGAKPIMKDANTGLSTGDIALNQIVSLAYDGTNFELLGGISSAVNLGGVQTLTSKTLSNPKISNGGFIADGNGNEHLKFLQSNAPVNEFTIQNANTGIAPQLVASGNDTNIDINLVPKGTGVVKVNGKAITMSEPIATYTHTTNKEVIPASVDFPSNTFTSIGHGLANNDLIGFVTNPGIYVRYPLSIYPTGVSFINNGYYVVGATTDTFQISLTNGGAPVALTAKGTMDLTKWHFERHVLYAGVTISNLPPKKKYRLRVKGKSAAAMTGVEIRPNGLSDNFTTSSISVLATPIITGFLGDVYARIDCDIECTEELLLTGRFASVKTSTDTANVQTSGVFTIVRQETVNTDITSIVFNALYPSNGTIIEVYNV